MSKTSLWVPDRAEIILIDFAPMVGEEMPGVHAMLVLSVAKFAEVTSIVVGFPMTHAASHETNELAVKTKDQHGKPSYVLTHQPKSFDWRARGARRHPMGTGHTKLLAEVLQKFDDIFATC